MIMIDDKEIDIAARAQVLSKHFNETAYFQLRSIEDFTDGAHWVINEFLKDLWHPASEEPREFAEVLAEAKITESIKTYISFKRNDALFKNWDAYSSGANTTRWLYIDDLLPKEGGEQ